MGLASGHDAKQPASTRQRAPLRAQHEYPPIVSVQVLRERTRAPRNWSRRVYLSRGAGRELHRRRPMKASSGKGRNWIHAYLPLHASTSASVPAKQRKQRPIRICNHSDRAAQLSPAYVPLPVRSTVGTTAFTGKKSGSARTRNFGRNPCAQECTIGETMSSHSAPITLLRSSVASAHARTSDSPLRRKQGE
jgi:hypothetical protein